MQPIVQCGLLLQTLQFACSMVCVLVTPFGGGADSCGPMNHVTDAVHTGATWRIRLNDLKLL